MSKIKNNKKKFNKLFSRTRKGAASFYVVVFSTLILLIVVTSFTSLVISQITRSSNDDLSQSAYDSALAGVEDAKLAFYNYQSCVAQGAQAVEPNNDGSTNCNEIVWMVENDESNCDVVAKILGRKIVDNYGVSVDETSTSTDDSNNMQQAYTCVKMQTSLKDYRTTLSYTNPIKVVNVKLDDMGNGSVSADLIDKVRVSWGADMKNSELVISNYQNDQIVFPKTSSGTKASNPPVISLALVQAGDNFVMDDFNLARYSSQPETNRATMFLVPVNTDGTTISDNPGNFNGTVFQNGSSIIEAKKVVETNDASKENLPFAVSCPNAGSFACSVEISLPKPIGGHRAENNFMFAMSMPYGNITTDVMLEFFCKNGESCGMETVACEPGDDSCTGQVPTNQANLKGMQIGIDSTGRANDLFRRVDTRLEGTDDFAISIMGPLELFGERNPDDASGLSLGKNYVTTCEYNFDPKTCN